MSIASDMEEQAARVSVVVGTVPVTCDPREASQAPDVAVLVDPPTRDHVERLNRWTLVVLRNTSDLGWSTTEALSEVVELLEKSEIPVEEATPGARRLSSERPAVPAYLVRYTSP